MRVPAPRQNGGAGRDVPEAAGCASGPNLETEERSGARDTFRAEAQ